MEYHIGRCIHVIHICGPSSYLMTYSQLPTYIRLTDACPCLKCSPRNGILNRYFRRYKDMTISGINSLYWTLGSITRSRRVRECLPLLFLECFGLFIRFERNGSNFWTIKRNKILSYSVYKMVSIIKGWSCNFCIEYVRIERKPLIQWKSTKCKCQANHLSQSLPT